jgi:MscS family membrane protein
VLEQLGAIRGKAGAELPVRLVRQSDTPEWRFSARTVARIDDWYEGMRGRWLLQHLPPALLQRSVGGLARWQLLALPVLFIGAVLLALASSKLLRTVVLRLAKTTRRDWDDELVSRLGGPLMLASLVCIMAVVKPFVALPEAMETTLTRGLRAATIVALFWSLARGIEVLRAGVSASPWIATRPGARGLLPVISRIAKVGVLGLAVVALLTEFGFPVASIVAGLGIGGLAIALAAQKTLENLFGAFSIGADQPLREGDFVKIEDFVGTVETIGLRSTRIRTLDRTLITLPNGRLADMRIESFSARERMRLVTTIGLVYETTSEQMRAVLTGLERVLRAHPKIWSEAVIVRFAGLGASSLDIEIMAWFQTPDWGEFQLIRQDVLLQFMDVVAAAGSSFAFPTQTVHIARDT